MLGGRALLLDREGERGTKMKGGEGQKSRKNEGRGGGGAEILYWANPEKYS